MIAALTNHLWQSTLFAGAIALLAAALRRNRAQVRYWLWLAASVKFLLPFALVMALGARLAPAPVAASRIVPSPVVAVAIDRAAQPFTLAFADGAAGSRPPTGWRPLAILAIWFAGCAAIVTLRLRSWRRVRAAIRVSTRIDLAAVAGLLETRSAPGLLEPGVVGVWRPVLLVPDGITVRLTVSQLAAVVAHELCHVRRRDNLSAAIHMVVEAAFWFHPLVWWIGARLVDERERACDEAVLDQGLDPREYAEGLLTVCRLYVESPLVCVAGVSGADIRARIEAIMNNRSGRGLNRPRKAALAVASVGALTAPVLAGMITAPLHQDPPKFEVASIRPCENGPAVPGGRGGGGGPRFSPGAFVFNCGTLEQLIQMAYLANGEPLLNESRRFGFRQDDVSAAFPRRIRGGPDWVRTDKYTIEAKTDVSTGRSGRDAQAERKIMMGPMLRALLEERFQLRLHRGSQNDVPMYAMTVAKGGLKIAPVGPDGGCIPTDPSQPPRFNLLDELAAVRRGGRPICGHGVLGGTVGAAQALLLNGQTMDGVADGLNGILDRHVLNQTGVEGKFIIYLEFAPDEHTPGPEAVTAQTPPSEAAGPSIFAALEKLGLKIEPATGPKGYIVIDRAERSSNR